MKAFRKQNPPAICFIDDEREERERFKANFAKEGRFEVGAGATLEEAVRNLGGRRPELFVLDMYWANPPPDKSELEKIHAAYQQLRVAIDNFDKVLRDNRQSITGGLTLAE